MPHKDRATYLEYLRRYNAARKEKTAKYNAEWKSRNLVRWHELQAAYRLKHRERKRDYARSLRSKDPEACRRRHRDWCMANPEKRAAQKRREWAKHGPKILRKSRLKRLENPEFFRALSRSYRQKHGTRWNVMRAESRRLNLDSARKKDRSHYAKNKERIRLLARNRYAKSAHLFRIAGARYRKANAVALKQKRLASYRANPAPFLNSSIRRRARMKNPSKQEMARIEDFIAAVRSKQVVVCYYCHREVPGKLVHIEHVTPLARGGKHELGNLCASCPTCNLSKQSKLPTEWIRDGQLFLI